MEIVYDSLNFRQEGTPVSAPRKALRKAPRTTPRKALAAAAALAAAVTAAALAPSPASATPPSATYTITIGSTGAYSYPTDTPASAFIDKDGTFYFQQSASLYGATDPHYWDFYSGTTFDDATRNATISNYVNPGNAQDANNNTVYRCEHSPTGTSSTSAPSGSGYALPNYCDLVGAWVDPDTGDWYGLVHNEFTPQPFGDGLHYDSIDYAVSHDQGRTWTIAGHALTSPYSTTRGDTTAFPNQTYYYGDGDQRLFVDPVSGYFYVYYGSRVVPKSGVGGSTGGLAHVARCPIASKMVTGCWQKWYNGAWSQPGVGGLESNMVPVDGSNANGYTPVAQDYSRGNTGTVDQQVSAGKLPSKSKLFIMNIAYDAYLGLYVGEPEVVSGTQPQLFYVTDDLSTQKWYLIGDSGTYTSGSWYRWFVDSANKTSSTLIGKSFRSYCSIACHGSDGEYANITIGSTAPAASPVDPTKTYTIGVSGGRVLAQVSASSATTSDATASGSALESWAFKALGDGSFQITNASTGQALGRELRRRLGAGVGHQADRHGAGRPAARPSASSGSWCPTRLPRGRSGSSTGTAAWPWACRRIQRGRRRPRRSAPGPIRRGTASGARGPRRSRCSASRSRGPRGRRTSTGRTR